MSVAGAPWCLTAYRIVMGGEASRLGKAAADEEMTPPPPLCPAGVAGAAGRLVVLRSLALSVVGDVLVGEDAAG